jgi:hypothetical protein
MSDATHNKNNNQTKYVTGIVSGHHGMAWLIMSGAGDGGDGYGSS